MELCEKLGKHVPIPTAFSPTTEKELKFKATSQERGKKRAKHHCMYFIYLFVSFVFAVDDVKRLDNTIYQRNHYPVENSINFDCTFLQGSDLSCG